MKMHISPHLPGGKGASGVMSGNEVTGTAKKGLFRIIFSRTGIILALILIQLILFIRIPYYLGEYGNYMYGLMTVLSVIVIIYINNSGV